MLLDVELRPARREILDEDTVAVVAEGVEEFLALRVGDQLGRNLDDNFAIALVGVNPFDVFDEFLEVEFETREPLVGFFRHAIDRDIDLVDAGFEHRANAIGRKERAVGRCVDILDVSRFLGVGDHVGETLVQERLAVLVHAQHLDRLFELAEVVDDLLKDVELHDALESAGLRDHVAMTGRAECAFEIAGAGRINEHDERRCQRNDCLQWRASDEIDSGFEPGFHGVSCDSRDIPHVVQDIG